MSADPGEKRATGWTISIDMLATTAVGFFLGRAIDEVAKSFPMGAGVGALLGVMAGVWTVYKKIFVR